MTPKWQKTCYEVKLKCYTFIIWRDLSSQLRWRAQNSCRWTTWWRRSWRRRASLDFTVASCPISWRSYQQSASATWCTSTCALASVSRSRRQNRLRVHINARRCAAFSFLFFLSPKHASLLWSGIWRSCLLHQSLDSNSCRWSRCRGFKVTAPTARSFFSRLCLQL